MSWSLQIERTTDMGDLPKEPPMEYKNAVVAQNSTAEEQFAAAWAAARAILASGAVGGDTFTKHGVTLSGHNPEANQAGTPVINVSVWAS